MVSVVFISIILLSANIHLTEVWNVGFTLQIYVYGRSTRRRFVAVNRSSTCTMGVAVLRPYPVKCERTYYASPFVSLRPSRSYCLSRHRKYFTVSKITQQSRYLIIEPPPPDYAGYYACSVQKLLLFARSLSVWPWLSISSRFTVYVCREHVCWTRRVQLIESHVTT